MNAEWLEKALANYQDEWAEQVREELAKYPSEDAEKNRGFTPETQAIHLLVYEAPIPSRVKPAMARQDATGELARRAWYACMVEIYNRLVVDLSLEDPWGCYDDYWDWHGIETGDDMGYWTLEGNDTSVLELTWLDSVKLTLYRFWVEQVSYHFLYKRHGNLVIKLEDWVCRKLVGNTED